ncbi:hypothetical protein MHK_006114, partial [Candidatus Magnetomorum sp. HK-1]
MQGNDCAMKNQSWIILSANNKKNIGMYFVKSFS